MGRETGFGKRMFIVLVLIAIIPFAFPFGHPMLSLNDINLGTLKKTLSTEKTEPAGFTLNEDQLSTPVTVYRWKDKSGAWSFSSRPPADGTTYTTITVQSDANLIRGAPVKTAEEQSDTTSTPAEENNNPLSALGYTPEDVAKIMQSAKEARAMIEQRYQQERAIIESQ